MYLMGRSTISTRSSSTHVETGAFDRCRDRAVLRARNVIDGKSGEHSANVVLAKELGSKSPVHPNDRVDSSPSSNDSFPTAMHIAAVLYIVHDLVPVSSELHGALRAEQKAFARIVKIGRAHTQNATPPTLGREFSAEAAQLESGTKRLELAVIEFISPKKRAELLDHVDACVWYDAFNSTARGIRMLVRRASHKRRTPRAGGMFAHYGNRARAKNWLRQCHKDGQIDARAHNHVERNGCAAGISIAHLVRPANPVGQDRARRPVDCVRVTPVKLRIRRAIYGTLILVIDHNR
jgi:hypothetical protein